MTQGETKIIIHNEFSHPLKLDQIGHDLSETLQANAKECDDLAVRFDLIAIDSLSARVKLTRDGDVIHAHGEMVAIVDQPCIASGEAVRSEINESLAIAFLPQIHYAPDEEIELDSGDCDVIFYNGKSIDIGEAVAQSLALALDPFPRSPNAESILKKAGVKTEGEEQEDSGPFAALAALKNKK